MAEVYNPGRFRLFASAHKLRLGDVFDIELGWDLLKPAHQQSVLHRIPSERPGLICLAPPRTTFSILDKLRFSTRFRAELAFQKCIKQARKLLSFCVAICLLRIQLKLSFVLEHPWSATSWKEPCLYHPSWREGMSVVSDSRLRITNACRNDQGFSPTTSRLPRP